MRAHACIRFLLGLLLLIGWSMPVAARSAGVGLDVSVDPGGGYRLQSHAPEWTFVGDIGHQLANIRASDGQDARLGRQPLAPSPLDGDDSRAEGGPGNIRAHKLVR